MKADRKDILRIINAMIRENKDINVLNVLNELKFRIQIRDNNKRGVEQKW